jgi:hypothetical protein
MDQEQLPFTMPAKGQFPRPTTKWADSVLQLQQAGLMVVNRSVALVNGK